jgi:murein L,D-transpeptidase YcbB/YkuD
VNGQLRQAPGPKAALGYVKIDIDSPFGVYLHDTPSRSLFSRDVRALSHGCVRVQSPRDLATLLLASQGWTREAVEAAIAAKSTRRVALGAPVPVILSYRTASAYPDGTVTFRPDVYGWDAKLIAAMARR